ncbi:MAG: glycosyltransferase family 2 protein [Alphaproteobacteria bacterium]|nr:glycosyltransferase family 2 protein [Alphaproteobacteria bacterium]MCB9696826.1 glycosyltransferase family 2 protein [Alphaproteobacteria bacterium]
MLSLCVIARDEEDRLGACLRSVAWAAEAIVVIDPRSRDATADVARREGARVVERAFEGHGPQREAARALARHRWCLFLDADERLSPEAGVALRSAMDGPAAGIRFPRRSSWLGTPLRHGRWGHDRVVRACLRDRGRWSAGLHERLEVDGPLATLGAPILHDPYRDWLEHLRTIDRYSRQHADELRHAGTRVGRGTPTARAVLHFVDAMTRRAAWLDGPSGVAVAALGAAHVHLKWSRAR